MRESWNGWLYSISIGDYRAANGASYEGKGIPPHIVVQNKREDVLNGVDEALERAVQQLQ
jgi:carboxyl-terminal processing protease